eukprot:6187542-Pleurochrysis_carterae.AAC.1
MGAAVSAAPSPMASLNTSYSHDELEQDVFSAVGIPRLAGIRTTVGVFWRYREANTFATYLHTAPAGCGGENFDGGDSDGGGAGGADVVKERVYGQNYCAPFLTSTS